MFKRSFRSQDSSTKRVDKTERLKKRDAQKLAKLQRSITDESLALGKQNLAPSPIINLTVGSARRLFAAHEDVLCMSPFFDQAVRKGLCGDSKQRMALPEEEPEIFSAVLEYLYKGDYYPRLLQSQQSNTWELEDTNPPQNSHVPSSPGTGGRRAPACTSTVFVSAEGVHVLRDTLIYCAADRYGLEELKHLSLRKQGLRSGIDVATILRSATYAYAHTPDSDSRLRAHYLALIIRCRKIFKRSGTMQLEMERGGSKLFFDLFVAMCNHLDDVVESTNTWTPKTI